MAIRQKRRIYDITHGLEGIGLIEKKSIHCVEWRFVIWNNCLRFYFKLYGSFSLCIRPVLWCNTREIDDKLSELKKEVASLDSLERQIDQHKQVISYFG